VHQDETGRWQTHARAWLRVASTAAVAVFLLVKSRGKAVAQAMLGTVVGTARQILKLKDALWTFVYPEGVEPTNNLAERDLRHAVI
jgi:hypothetical protein